jgi:hypothetical protein
MNKFHSLRELISIMESDDGNAVPPRVSHVNEPPFLGSSDCTITLNDNGWIETVTLNEFYERYGSWLFDVYDAEPREDRELLEKIRAYISDIDELEEYGVVHDPDDDDWGDPLPPPSLRTDSRSSRDVSNTCAPDRDGRSG